MPPYWERLCFPVLYLTRRFYDRCEDLTRAVDRLSAIGSISGRPDSVEIFVQRSKSSPSTTMLSIGRPSLIVSASLTDY